MVKNQQEKTCEVDIRGDLDRFQGPNSKKWLDKGMQKCPLYSCRKSGVLNINHFFSANVPDCYVVFSVTLKKLTAISESLLQGLKTFIFHFCFKLSQLNQFQNDSATHMLKWRYACYWLINNNDIFENARKVTKVQNSKVTDIKFATFSNFCITLTQGPL